MPLKIETEVLISGAGPGGIMTALALAQKGIHCVIAEKAVFPRDKICGDALSGKVIDLFQKKYPEWAQELRTHPMQIGSYGVSFVAPNREKLDVPFKTGYNKNTMYAPGCIIKRIDFDYFLFQKLAQFKNHIQVLAPYEMKYYTSKKNSFTAEDTHRSIQVEAKMIVAADGAFSNFNRFLHPKNIEPQHYCAGIRTYMSGIKDIHSDNFIELHFLKKLLPGYFWIFPLPNGCANVGLGVRSDIIQKKKLNLKKLFQEIIESEPSIAERFVAAEMKEDIKGFGLPLASKKRSLSGHHYLLVGDAASLIDPFTGEGIGNAMISGWIAAEHIALCFQKSCFSASFNKNYDQAVYHRLGSEFQLSTQLQRLVQYPSLFNFVVNKAKNNTALQQTISMMFENLDIRKQLRNPAFYYRLIFS